MASENSPQARAAANTRNLAGSLGLKPVTKAAPVGIAKARPSVAPTPTPAADTGTPAADTSVSNYVADVTPMAAAEPDVSEETLKKTAEYMARERALQAALDLFGANQATEGARYGETYNKNLADLGWRGDVNDWDYGQLLSSGQKATESGRAFQSLSNDFAARGMLQSGAYQGARSILQNQLNDKRAAVEKGKVTFGEDQTSKRNAFLAEQEQARTQALADARAAILGGMGV